MPSAKFTPESLPDLRGKVYIVTGGNTGCGRSTVVGLAAKGAKVYMGARNEQKALAAIEEIKAKLPSTDIYVLKMDLTDLRSVVDAAKVVRKKETSLNGLVNNAGILLVPRAMTSDGFEVQFQTNYISHWLLTYHLLPLLLSTARSSEPGAVRIVDVTSDGHIMAPKEGIRFDDTTIESGTTFQRYGQSKLGNLLHCKALDKRYGPKAATSKGEIWCAAVHPGHIYTNMTRDTNMSFAPQWLTSTLAGVLYSIGYLDNEEKGDSGAYIVPYAQIGTPSKTARDEELTERLWVWTKDQLQEKGFLKDL